MRTSENSVTAKFAEIVIGEVRRIHIPRTCVNKGKRRGHRRRRQSNLQQRGAQKTRHGDSGLPPYVLCETHSSGSIRREGSLLTAPVRIIVVISVVGDWGPTTPAGFYRIDLSVGSGCLVDIGYLLTGRSVVGEVVVRGVVGEWFLASSAGIDGVDLCVLSVVALEGYLLAGRRVGRLIVARGVVGELFLASSVRIDGVDLCVGSVVALEGYLLAGRRVGRVIVVRGVVSELFLASSAGIDGVDLVVTGGCFPARIGYLLAVR